MQFKIGDQVVHTSHGRGQIMAIEEKRLAGKDARLFYVVATHQSTVWVPVESDSAPSLRLTASKSALAGCRDLLKSRPAALNVDRRQRYLEMTRRLQGSSFEIQCEVVRDLTALSWPKPLCETDSQALRKIREAVCLEWATAAGVPLVEATHEVTALLQEGRQTYNI